MMLKSGMTIGSHGHDHMWMDRINPAEQRREVELGLEFLEDIGVPSDRWMMAYPYGAYNETLVDICRELGCGAAFTTRVGIAEVNVETRLELLRLDTNDIPNVEHDAPGEWTSKVTSVAQH
jgi:peptidoglycan/xylan/chitin deacetylase (PgdA/CDA1 family)